MSFLSLQIFVEIQARMRDWHPKYVAAAAFSPKKVTPETVLKRKSDRHSEIDREFGKYVEAESLVIES